MYMSMSKYSTELEWQAKNPQSSYSIRFVNEV